MTEARTITAWDRAVEAAARGIFGGIDEVWESVPQEQAHYRRAAERAVAAALPVLLETLAEQINERRPHIPPSTDPARRERLIVRSTLNQTARLVRDFAADVPRGQYGPTADYGDD